MPGTVTLSDWPAPGVTVSVTWRSTDTEPDPTGPPLAAHVLATGITDDWGRVTIAGIPRVDEQFTHASSRWASAGKYWATGQLPDGTWRRTAFTLF